MVNSLAIGLGIAVRAFAVILNIAGGIVPDITADRCLNITLPAV
jgi:hypothetical protein